MIEYILYKSDTRSFSIEDEQIALDMENAIKYVNGLKFNSKIGKSILPAIKMTSYKYTPYPSALTSKDPKFKARQLDLIKKLKKKVPEVPVFIATKFKNACFVPDWDKIVEQWGDEDLKLFCEEMGLNYSELQKNTASNIVIMGTVFYNAPTLAHEFGHYLNTFGKGEPEGKRAHELYGKRASTSGSLTAWGILIDLGAGLALITGNLLPGSIAALLSAGLTGIAALISKPILVAEKTASITGLKLLKAVGITDIEYKEFMDDLAKAFNTYKEGYVRFNLKASALSGVVGAAGVLTHVLRK